MANVLRIECPKIVNIPASFFDFYCCENIEILYLNCASLEILHVTDFDNFCNVKHLTLIANKMQTIERNSFDNLSKIEILYLQAITLNVINKKLFFKLFRLQKLSLIVPNVSKVSSQLLKFNKRLKYLKMDHSFVLNETFFNSIKAIEIFDWRSSNILGPLQSENLILPKLKCLKLNNHDFQFNDLIYLPKLTTVHIVNSVCVDQCFDKIFRSSNLNVVNFSRNENLSVINFTKFTEQNSVTYFDMSYNCVELIYLKSFQNFVNLQFLNLSYNCLNVDFCVFKDLRSLKVLNLSHNEIRMFNFVAIGNYLRQLRILNLSFNYFKLFFHNLKTHFASLSHVFLSYNDIISLDLVFMKFATNSNLVVLDFQFNRITRIMYNFFWEMRHLKYLYLNENMIRDLNSCHFERLECLQYLDLSHNFIQFLDYDLFENLYSLITLKLSFNVIDFIPVGLFRKMCHLHLLDLRSNKITEIPSEIFKSCHSLKYLYLSSNSLTFLNDNIFFYSRFLVIDLSLNRFQQFSKYIILNNQNHDCCWVIDDTINRYLVIHQNFQNFKFVIRDF